MAKGVWHYQPDTCGCDVLVDENDEHLSRPEATAIHNTLIDGQIAELVAVHTDIEINGERHAVLRAWYALMQKTYERERQALLVKDLDNDALKAALDDLADRTVRLLHINPEPQPPVGDICPIHRGAAGTSKERFRAAKEDNRRKNYALAEAEAATGKSAGEFTWRFDADRNVEIEHPQLTAQERAAVAGKLRARFGSRAKVK